MGFWPALRHTLRMGNRQVPPCMFKQSHPIKPAGINILQPFYFSVLTYNISLIFVKVSILLLYLRIFDSSRTRYGCYILLGVVITYGAFLILSSIFSCWPIGRFWDNRIPGHCIPGPPLWYGNAAANIATDLAIFILPLKTIYGLKLPRGQKISLCFVFTLGFLYVAFLPTPNRNFAPSVCQCLLTTVSSVASACFQSPEFPL